MADQKYPHDLTISELRSDLERAQTALTEALGAGNRTIAHNQVNSIIEIQRMIEDLRGEKA